MMPNEAVCSVPPAARAAREPPRRGGPRPAPVRVGPPDTRTPWPLDRSRVRRIRAEGPALTSAQYLTTVKNCCYGGPLPCPSYPYGGPCSGRFDLCPVLDHGQKLCLYGGPLPLDHSRGAARTRTGYRPSDHGLTFDQLPLTTV